MRLYRPTRGTQGSSFKRANDCCSHGHDAPSLAPGAIHRVGRVAWNRVALAMQAHLVYPLHAQRRKRAQAHMERHTRYFDTLDGDLVEHLRRKVQSRSGSGNRTAFPRKDRLVPLSVSLRVVAPNVRRQRHVPDAVERPKEIIHRRKSQQALAELAALHYFGFERDLAVGRWERQPLAHADLFPRLHQRAPRVFASRFRQQDFYHPAWLLAIAHHHSPRIQPRWNHAAVVEHQQIAGSQQGRELGELTVAQLACRAVHQEHATLVALRRRLLRNQLRRKFKIEIGDPQSVHETAPLVSPLMTRTSQSARGPATARARSPHSIPRAWPQTVLERDRQEHASTAPSSPQCA